MFESRLLPRLGVIAPRGKSIATLAETVWREGAPYHQHLRLCLNNDYERYSELSARVQQH